MLWLSKGCATNNLLLVCIIHVWPALDNCYGHLPGGFAEMTKHASGDVPTELMAVTHAFTDCCLRKIFLSFMIPLWLELISVLDLLTGILSQLPFLNSSFLFLIFTSNLDILPLLSWGSWKGKVKTVYVNCQFIRYNSTKCIEKRLRVLLVRFLQNPCQKLLKPNLFW